MSSCQADHWDSQQIGGTQVETVGSNLALYSVQFLKKHTDATRFILFFFLSLFDGLKRVETYYHGVVESKDQYEQLHT